MPNVIAVIRAWDTDVSPSYLEEFSNTPYPLYPIQGRINLTTVVQSFQQNEVRRIYIVINEKFKAQYEHWKENAKIDKDSRIKDLFGKVYTLPILANLKPADVGRLFFLELKSEDSEKKTGPQIIYECYQQTEAIEKSLDPSWNSPGLFVCQGSSWFVFDQESKQSWSTLSTQSKGCSALFFWRTKDAPQGRFGELKIQGEVSGEIHQFKEKSLYFMKKENVDVDIATYLYYLKKETLENMLKIDYLLKDHTSIGYYYSELIAPTGAKKDKGQEVPTNTKGQEIKKEPIYGHLLKQWGTTAEQFGIPGNPCYLTWREYQLILKQLRCISENLVKEGKPELPFDKGAPREDVIRGTIAAMVLRSEQNPITLTELRQLGFGI
jgi:hypothetical protein